MRRIPLRVNPATRTIDAPHWGYTLRTLFGAAVSALDDANPGEERTFTVRMKGRPIATISVRKHEDLN